jgi:hypothetical protein
MIAQEEVLRDAAVRARKAKERQESRVSGSEQRAALVAAKNASAKRLRKEEVRRACTCGQSHVQVHCSHIC